MDATDPGVLAGQGFDGLQGAVRGIVVHEDHLPRHACQNLVELVANRLDVAGLVQRGDDDGEFSGHDNTTGVSNLVNLSFASFSKKSVS